MILTGAVRSGKTGFLAGVVSELNRRGVKLAGFLSPAACAGARHIGYDLRSLARDEAIPFIRRTGEPNWERVGDFFFLPAALEEARRLVRESPADGLLVVDEVGPLEMAGGGLWAALEPALADRARRCLIVVREGCLVEFLGRLGDRPARVFRPSEPGAAASLLSEIRKQEAAAARGEL